MATYYARKAGNINAADVWATTPSGTASNLFPTFTNADVLVANSFTITVNVSTTVAEVRNDTTGGATIGGTFALGSGVLLKANVFSAYFSNGAACVTSSVSASIEGNITITNSGNASSQLNRAVLFTGSTGATLAINGNIVCPPTFTHSSIVDFQGLGGQLSITGNLLGNAASGNNSIMLDSKVTSTGSVVITGSISAGNATGLSNSSNNLPVTVTGTVTGGNSGVFGISNFSTSTITVGMANGGVGGAGVSNASTGTIRLTRAVGNAYGPSNTAGLAAAPGAANVGLGVIEIEQLEYGTFGQSPTSGTGIRLKKASTNVAIFNYCDTAGAKTLIDATQNASMPAASDVRLGVSYASGAATGSCAVPAAGSVSLGVPVDNTTGTAILTQANVQSALTAQGLTTARAGNLDNLDTTVSSRLSPSGTLATVTNLTNAPSVPSAGQIASQVWAVADKTGYSLTTAERSAIAAAVEASILNEGDGQAILNAIVTAIGNSNVDQVALVAAIRSDIAAIKSKTDALPASPAATGDIPSANIGAIKAKTDLLNTDRLAQVSTVSTTGAQLAAALS